MSRQGERLANSAQNQMTKGNQDNSLVSQLQRMMPQLGIAMSNAISPEMLARTAQTEIRKTPKLAHCTPASFFGALFDCAQLGLMPGPLGHIYLIPYGTECTLIIGYKGLLELCYRSPRIESIEAHVVYEGDEFKQIMGLNPDLIHIPCEAENRGEISHVYAVARIKDMRIPRFEVMSRKDVDAIRSRSASAKGRTSPWDTDYGEMAKKTVLRRLIKTLPISTDIQDQINRDERVTHAVERDGQVILEDYASTYDLAEPEPEEKKEEKKSSKPTTAKGKARKDNKKPPEKKESAAGDEKKDKKGETKAKDEEPPHPADSGDEVPEGVDPETGEVLTDGNPTGDDDEEGKPNLFNQKK